MSTRPERTIVADGISWTVFEHTPRFDRRATSTLVFDATKVVRRVRTFPADWMTVDEAVLIALCLAK